MRSSSAGFTLRELFVVVTSVGILLAILVPAIRSASEASRRMSCSNNFKQIGIGIHNYHSAYKVIPAAMSGTAWNEFRLSGLVAMAPFLEASPFWETVANPMVVGGKDFPPMGPVPWESAYPPWAKDIATYRCPSDWRTGPSLGRTNYTFSVGDRVRDLYSSTDRNEIRGMVGSVEYMKFRDVLDGLANTIMMTEIGSEHGQRIQGQFSTGHPALLADSPADCLKSVDPKTPMAYVNSATLNELGRGGAFADGSGGFSLVQTILPPNSPSCAIGNDGPFSGVFSAGSYHPGGCHVLMGDGAVIFMTNSIHSGDPKAPSPVFVRDPDGIAIGSPYGLWGELGTRAGHEAIVEQLVL